MNDSSKLFIFSVILVPSLLISVNYTAIHDFYTYSTPLNSLEIEHGAYGLIPFQKIQNMEGSACFITPILNQFCYTKPHMFEKSGISYVRGTNGVEGEMHFDPVNTGIFYFTIKNMTKINNDEAIITLSDKDFRIGNEKAITYEIADKFEYSTTIKKFDTFISYCDNYEGTSATVVQYLGIAIIDGVEYFMTWHVPATSEQGIQCDYPQIIQHSFGHKFKDL